MRLPYRECGRTHDEAPKELKLGLDQPHVRVHTLLHRLNRKIKRNRDSGARR